MASAMVYQKQIDGSYYVVQAVPDTKKRTTYIVSAYMQKNEGPRFPIAPNGASGGVANTVTMHSPLGNSISPNAENSNRTAENIQSKKKKSSEQ